MSYFLALSQLFFHSFKAFSFPQILFTIPILIFTFFVATFLYCGTRRYLFSTTMPVKPIGFFTILGNVYDIQTMLKDFPLNVAIFQLVGGLSKLLKKSKLFCVWITYVPFIVIMKAEALQELITNPYTSKKGWTYDYLVPWLGTGLLTSYGKKWKSRRKLLTPSFHFDILKEFLPIFNSQSQTLIEILQNETSKEWTDIVTLVTLCSLDIISESTLGVKIDAQKNQTSEYVQAVLREADIVAERMINWKYWLDVIFKFTEAGKQEKADRKLLHDFTKSVINEKKQKLLNGEVDVTEKKRKAFMDVLLEHHIRTKELTEEDIREEVDTFTFEGHDTTSMGMSWALYLIGLHPDVQESLQEEMDRIFGNDKIRPITKDDINDMTYLDRVLKESQRLFPSVPMIAREVTEDIKICGYTVPKHSQCTCFIYFLHRDESVFPNPEKFDPDRFLPENNADRNPYAYIPFSAGPRNCIGQRFAVMEEKVIVSNILRNFSLESLDHRDKLLLSSNLILRPSSPLRIKLRPRNFD